MAPKYADHETDDWYSYDPDCPLCHGTNKVAVANGPDDFDYEVCWKCSGEGDEDAD